MPQHENCKLVPEIKFALEGDYPEWWEENLTHLEQCHHCEAEGRRVLAEHPEYLKGKPRSVAVFLAENLRDLVVGFTALWVADDLMRKR